MFHFFIPLTLNDFWLSALPDENTKLLPASNCFLPSFHPRVKFGNKILGNMKKKLFLMIF